MQAKSATATKVNKPKKYAPAGPQSEPTHYPTLVNKPGEMVWLPKGDLKVDKTYQRPVNPRAVHRISANWNWVACGVLIVSLRSDGTYYIVDGQHRWEAAKKLDNVTNVACLVFELNNVIDEASGFLAANTERQVPLMIHRFNALVAIKDRVALVADELIRSSGRTLRRQTGKQYISCVGDLMRCLRSDKTTVYHIWPLIVELTREQTLPGTLVKGMFYLERKMPTGYSLNDRTTRERVLRTGADAMNKAILEVASFEGKRGEKQCAMGILRAINKGSRNPIKINLD